MARRRLSLIEFPADDPDRARRFWSELLGAPLEARSGGEGEGWQSREPAPAVGRSPDPAPAVRQSPEPAPAVGVHVRGRGPGDSFSLPYFAVGDLDAALEQVRALGGSVVHPGARWAICKDSEGSPFGLALNARGVADV